MSILIKFWKDDFKYIKRSGYTHFFVEGFGYCYTFTVRGESANYLMNKYNLKYPYVKVYLTYGHNAITVRVVSETEDKSQFDNYNICEEDFYDLVFILQKEVWDDLRNYEEWKCNSDYYKRDSRWM